VSVREKAPVNRHIHACPSRYSGRWIRASRFLIGLITASSVSPFAALPATAWRLNQWAKAGVFDQLHLDMLDRLGEQGRLDCYGRR
jgi:hypothetical protein